MFIHPTINPSELDGPLPEEMMRNKIDVDEIIENSISTTIAGITGSDVKVNKWDYIKATETPSNKKFIKIEYKVGSEKRCVYYDVKFVKILSDWMIMEYDTEVNDEITLELKMDILELINPIAHTIKKEVECKLNFDFSNVEFVEFRDFYNEQGKTLFLTVTNEEPEYDDYDGYLVIIDEDDIPKGPIVTTGYVFVTNCEQSKSTQEEIQITQDNNGVEVIIDFLEKFEVKGKPDNLVIEIPFDEYRKLKEQVKDKK